MVAKKMTGLIGLLGLTMPVCAAADDYPNFVAGNDDAVRLQPASPWNIDFGESRCRLTRLFGSAEEKHLVFIEQAAPRSSFGLTLAGPEVRRFTNARRLELGMMRGEPMEEQENFGAGEVATIGPAIILSAASLGLSDPDSSVRRAGVDLTQAEAADRIVMRSRNRVISFETGNLMPPMQALNTCTSDLLRAWGLDPEKHEAYTPPSWINSDQVTRRIVAQYPRAALNRGEQAIFRMRVIIETDGKVSDCFIENSTETERLESPACREMMRASFEPALDAQGQPMRSFYATSVTYSIG